MGNVMRTTQHQNGDRRLEFWARWMHSGMFLLGRHSICGMTLRVFIVKADFARSVMSLSRDCGLTQGH